MPCAKFRGQTKKQAANVAGNPNPQGKAPKFQGFPVAVETHPCCLVSGNTTQKTLKEKL